MEAILNSCTGVSITKSKTSSTCLLRGCSKKDVEPPIKCSSFLKVEPELNGAFVSSFEFSGNMKD